MNLSLSSILRIVGITLIVIAMAMIPSLIVSFIYDDSAIYIPFLMTMLAACAAGFLLVKSCHRETLNLKDPRRLSHSVPVLVHFSRAGCCSICRHRQYPSFCRRVFRIVFGLHYYRSYCIG